MRRYLNQLAVSLRPGSVETIDTTLRMFARFIADHHPDVTGAADIGRTHIEAFKPWLAARPGKKGREHLSPTTVGMRLGHLRGFLGRIIDWEYDDAPRRNPVLAGDIPIKNRALPRFLDDPTATKLLIAARNLPDPFDRLTVEMLARTGMRRGNSSGSPSTPSSRSAQRSGSEPQSGNSTTTATSRCTPTSKNSSTTGSPNAPKHSEATSCSVTGDGPSQAHALTGPSNEQPQQQGSATSTPTNSATPSPPKPSTEA